MKEKVWEPMKPMMQKEHMMGEVESEAEDASEPQDYEIKEAADCLLKAEEIKKDKTLYTAAMEHLHGKKSAIESIADLRKKAFSDSSDEESSPESKKKEK